MSDETRRLLANLSLLSGALDDYVEEDDQITEDAVEALNEAVATIRKAILKLDNLEKYSEELEIDILNLKETNEAILKENDFVKSIQTPDYVRVQTELWQYQKALDKACEVLEEGYGEEYACYIYMIDCDNGINIPSHMDKEQWKAWLMNDE